jgi:hypothetical protein
MANVSKLIFGVAIAAASIATPALAALTTTVSFDSNPLLSGNTVNPVLSGNTVVQGHEAASLPISLLNQTTGTNPFTGLLCRRGSLWDGGGP